MSKIVIFDLDGTLADNSHRRPYIMKPAGEKREWKTYNALMYLDKPNFAIVALLQDICYSDQAKYIPIIFTGREECYRQITVDWLMREVLLCDYSINDDGDPDYGLSDMLFMRTTGDNRDDTIIKKEMLDRLLADNPNYEIAFAVDDRDRVVKMWRDNGITCLQCAEGNF